MEIENYYFIGREKKKERFIFTEKINNMVVININKLFAFYYQFSVKLYKNFITYPG